MSFVTKPVIGQGSSTYARVADIVSVTVRLKFILVEERYVERCVTAVNGFVLCAVLSRRDGYESASTDQESVDAVHDSSR